MSEDCTQPLVSILINNYNYGRFLAEAIDSALAQTYPNVEVIVVDDGSTDESRSVIDRYGDRIRAILKENGGQASAFNAGFAASRGDIICFLDADDIFSPEKADVLVQDFQKYPEVNWYFHILRFFGNSNELQCSSEPEDHSGVYDLRSFMEKGRLNGCLPFEVETATSGMCFQRSLLQTILPMPEVIRITSDDYIKYAALGTSIGFISFQALAAQRIHGDNAYTSRPNSRSLKAKIQVLTAYNLKEKFPTLTSFSNNLVAMGISICWWLEIVESDLDLLIKTYIATTTPLEKLKIYVKAGYYRFLRHRLAAIGGS